MAIEVVPQSAQLQTRGIVVVMTLQHEPRRSDHGNIDSNC